MGGFFIGVLFHPFFSGVIFPPIEYHPWYLSSSVSPLQPFVGELALDLPSSRNEESAGGRRDGDGWGKSRGESWNLYWDVLLEVSNDR